ncbi:MAG: hypothetical protein IJG13_21005 [Kiritimatiellae bacterium]|nr:hypothetical protein [Kiritimatiellia bacterium]MBQ3344537.1 hypothetical protein [Kiritimatiellia bacterium]
MAIGVDQIYLSMKNPDTGEYLMADVYTVEGVENADGSPRLLSIGQLVMALCLKRAHDLEMGYNDSITGQHVDGVLEIMNSLETNTEILECLTKIETDTLDGDVNLKTKKLTFQGEEMTYYDFLTRQTGVENVPTGTVNSKSTEFISALEAEMDSRNSFSQQTMIQLQSQTTKRDQAYDMISNTLKSLNNVLVGNANNM